MIGPPCAHRASHLDNLGPPAAAHWFRIVNSFCSGSVLNRFRAWTICRSELETSSVSSRTAGPGASTTFKLQIETRPASHEPAYVLTQWLIASASFDQFE